MKPNNMTGYLQALTKIIEATDKTGGEMNPDFTKLSDAIENDKVADLDEATLTAIKTTFQKGTDAYTDNLNQLQQASVPVRLLGKHKQLVAAYRNYADACQKMVDAIDPAAQTVDTEAFATSENEQENMMDKVTSATQRIMSSVM